MDIKKAERIIKEIVANSDLLEQFADGATKAVDKLKEIEREDVDALRELNSIQHFSGFRLTLQDAATFGQDTKNCGSGACGTDTTCKQGACITNTSDCGGTGCGTDTTCNQGSCVTDTSDCGKSACGTNGSSESDMLLMTRAGPCVERGIEASVNVRFDFDVRFPAASVPGKPRLTVREK
ncbi:hypothetical protein POI8812_03493 [Pontivivens insulae]|uniref:Uncharacterized protein n=2 Tax=Pontivivens insulae TaxID=1639689 RepID=A0A2R8AFV6_9RHOB|nr:hypothetical protein DFR53_3464 [Pontivivens insulae]SPF31142.1 hypothetical protein POI8812_03493 [Pontivivens insulae]